MSTDGILHKDWEWLFYVVFVIMQTYEEYLQRHGLGHCNGYNQVCISFTLSFFCSQKHRPISCWVYTSLK